MVEGFDLGHSAYGDPVAVLNMWNPHALSTWVVYRPHVPFLIWLQNLECSTFFEASPQNVIYWKRVLSYGVNGESSSTSSIEFEIYFNVKFT